MPSQKAPSQKTTPVRAIGRPVFAQPEPTPDPKTFKIKHASDTASYHDIDKLNAAHELFATVVPPPRATQSGSLAAIAAARADRRRKTK